MGEKTVNAIVEGGNATTGPPLGPGLAPLGVNVVQVVAKINEETQSFAGLKVPVKVIVDTSNKNFKIEIGAPPTAELVKKAAGIEKGSGTKDASAGNISFSALVEIAKGIKTRSYGKSLKEIAKEIVGTCLSMNVTIETKNAKEIEKEIKEGKYDLTLVG